MERCHKPRNRHAVSVTDSCTSVCCAVSIPFFKLQSFEAALGVLYGYVGLELGLTLYYFFFVNFGNYRVNTIM